MLFNRLDGKFALLAAKNIPRSFGVISWKIVRCRQF
jgi:hypothetical protein